jgi:multidrug efflux system membrane fusion protein
MAQQDSQDTRSHGEDLGQSFEAHSGNVGSAFEERNATPEIVVVKKSHTTLWVLLILAAVVIAGLVYYFTGKSSSGGGAAGAGGRGQNGPAAITVGQSTTGNINIYVDALGTVTPVATVTLYSQITGVVVAVHYREGQMVRKGDPLVDIDPRPYQATLTQAEGTLLHDQGVLDEAKMDLTRYQAALAKNAIAKQQVDDQEKLVVQDEGTVKSDQGTVDYDKVQLSYCHIVAPITGKVGLRLVDPGNTVFSGSSSTLVVITQLQPITVVFNVSEDSLPEVQAQLKGNRVLEVDAFDRADEKQIEAGKLTSLDNQIDTTTGTVKFRASFQNKNVDLFPNQFVNARLLVRTLNNATLVPTAAVQHNGTAAFVYLVTPKHTVTVQPITAITNNESVTAVTGIGTGVSLATSGFDRLENNAPVQVHQGKPAASGSSATSGKLGPSTGGTTTK